jgi:hypothetical protein
MRSPLVALAQEQVQAEARAVVDTLHAVVKEMPRDRTPVTVRALEHCKAEWMNAHATAIENGKSKAEALRMAQVAYKLAMPKMDSMPAIKAAISCIAQGIALEVFSGRDGSQLLYAAQVAIMLYNRREGKK